MMHKVGVSAPFTIFGQKGMQVSHALGQSYVCRCEDCTRVHIENPLAAQNLQNEEMIKSKTIS
jgi:hypothetical protein